MEIYNQNFIKHLSRNEHFSWVKIAMKFNFALILKSIICNYLISSARPQQLAPVTSLLAVRLRKSRPS